MYIRAVIAGIASLLSPSPNGTAHHSLSRRTCRSMSTDTALKLGIINANAPSRSPRSIAQDAILPDAWLPHAEQANIKAAHTLQGLGAHKDGGDPSAFDIHKGAQGSRIQKWYADCFSLPRATMVARLLAKLISLPGAGLPELTDEAAEQP